MIATDHRNPLFHLGRVVATPAALAALEEAGQTPSEFLDRHAHGDLGTLTPEDQEANNRAIRDGGRILSAHLLKSGTKVWIITEADRSSTCILLPGDY
jgi:hypothetical protein